jgi:hypothetical protein
VVDQTERAERDGASCLAALINVPARVGYPVLFARRLRDRA